MVIYTFMSTTSFILVNNIVLMNNKVAQQLRGFRENKTFKQQWVAMYSSIVGGVTTDPVAMVIPIDDHMVHRGHGVFDTTAIMDG